MNYKKVFKRETKVIAYVVIALTIVVLGSSYALFMQVKDDTKNQVVTAGSLKIEYSNKNQTDSAQTVDENGNTCLTPMADDNGKTSGCSFQLSITNTGTLPMLFDLLIYDDKTDTSLNNLVDHKYIKYHLTKQVTTSSPKSSTLATDLQAETVEDVQSLDKLESKKDSEEADKDKKVLTNGTIKTGETITYSLKIWISEDAPDDLVGKNVNLKLDVSGTVDETEADKEINESESTNAESDPTSTTDNLPSENENEEPQE